MKFEVTNMLPVYSTAVKRRLLKLLSSAWLLVYAVGFQLNDVIASTALKEYDVIRQITDLRVPIIKQEVKLSRGLSIRRIQKHGSKGYQKSGKV